MESKKGLYMIIIILILIILVLGGYICFDKLILKEEQSKDLTNNSFNVSNNNKQNNVLLESNIENKVNYIQNNNEYTSQNVISNFNNTIINESINNINNTIIDNTLNTNNTDIDSDNSSQIVLNGKYRNKSETDNYYHDANLIVNNQNNSSIDFELSAVHGRDIDHVNIGEVKGTAEKIGTDKYQFVDVIDGKTHKITFEFTAHRLFQYVNIIESYPDNINPYAGNNVYFSGEYEKIS